jgi:crossover junction endodeoxyribonuclease RusA
MITLSLPILPPSVNALYRNVPGVGRVKTKRYKAWQAEAGWALAPHLRGHKTITGDVRVNIILKRRGDIDNKCKALLDLLTTHGVYADDKQVCALSIQAGDIEGCVIEVEAVSALHPGAKIVEVRV